MRGAAWSGGALAGGVTRVTDETVLAAPARSAAFRADAGNGRITLTGTVADEAARLALAEFAMRLFPAGAEAHLAVDPAATAGEDWETAVKRLIAQLARLDSGGAVLNVRRAGLYGRAGTGQTARAAAAALDDMPEGYSAAALVLALDAPAGDPGRGAAAQIGDARDCGLVLEAARGPAPVRFLPGQAALEPRSRRIAARLGEAFRFCPEGVLAVAVQPTGDSPYEQSMAAARAREVAAALTEGGAPAARVEAGAGETGQGRLVRLAVRAPAGEG
ncbi:MAG: hypothetical protein KIS81_10860 [Maricaulaceae bacterium]|nr:hypothetical protein [Maricaulaceae bacterium]